MFDEAKIVDARKFVGKCKATVQRSGRLGFTETAQDEMGLERGARLLVSDIGEGNLAVVVLPPNQADDRGFEIKRSGIYFSVNMKAFFDQQGVRYHLPIATAMAMGKPGGSLQYHMCECAYFTTSGVRKSSAGRGILHKL